MTSELTKLAKKFKAASKYLAKDASYEEQLIRRLITGDLPMERYLENMYRTFWKMGTDILWELEQSLKREFNMPVWWCTHPYTQAMVDSPEAGKKALTALAEELLLLAKKTKTENKEYTNT